MQKVTRVAATAAALVAGVCLPSCGSGVGNSAPRLATLPSPTTAGGGTVFSLDLGTYVTDGEGGPLAYVVTAGGGAFSGSTYSNTFDTMGTYTVSFRVSDSGGKSATGTFTVHVTSASFAAVQQGDDLALLDVDTGKLITVTGAPGFADTVKATLATGHVVYERAAGTTQLYVYDPSARSTTTLGNAADESTRFAAATAQGHVAFTRAKTATPADLDLYVWNVETDVTKPISTQSGLPEGSAFAAGDGRIFFERGTIADVWVWDPASDTASAVVAGATSERIQAVLADGSVIFTRVGSGGESDLHRYKSTVGEVEIGSDVTALATLTKTYRAATSDGKVVLEASAASTDLYVWNPATGATTAIATGGVHETFAALTALDEVVFHVATGAGNQDISLFTYGGSPAVRVVSSDAANDVYNGATAAGDVVFTRQGSPHSLHVYRTATSALATLASGGADNHVFQKVLSGGKVAYSKGGATAGVFVVNTVGAAAPATVASGAGTSFAGETSGGDFVVQTTASSQTDLVLWDESALAVVTISSTAGNDAFGAGLSGGRVLFTRVVAGKTTSDLFLWSQSAGTTTQLTDAAANHVVVTTYSASNP